MLIAISANAQFTNEKLHDVLCGTDQKSWVVSGTNINRPEKKITFRVNNTADMEDKSQKTKQVKWSLQSADNIRWFIDIGGTKYELIVSYNKNGEQYLKLTHHDGDEYEMKLNQIK